MQAIVQDRFGKPDALEFREVEQPDVGDDESWCGSARRR